MKIFTLRFYIVFLLLNGLNTLFANPGEECWYGSLTLNATFLTDNFTLEDLDFGTIAPNAVTSNTVVVDPSSDNTSTGGFEEGLTMMRWQGADGHPGEEPKFELVRLDKVLDYLPRDTTVVGPQDRSMEISERRSAIDARYQ